MSVQALAETELKLKDGKLLWYIAAVAMHTVSISNDLQCVGR